MNPRPSLTAPHTQVVSSDKRSGLAGGWHIWDPIIIVALVGAILGVGLWVKSPWYVILAASFNVVGGFFNAKTSKMFFPLSIGYSLCYLNVAFTNNLYGEVATTLLLIVIAVISIVKWLRAPNIKQSTYEINPLEPLFLLPMAILGVAAFLAYGFTLRHFGSRLPFLSAGTAVVSICAYILASKRVRMQWVLWLVNNAIFLTIWIVTMATTQDGAADLAELPLVMQALVYVALNVFGLVNWNAEWRRRIAVHEPDDPPEAQHN